MTRSRIRFLTLGVSLLMLLSLLTACGATSSTGSGTSTKKIRVGLVTDVGGLNDKGFNHLADLGLEKAKTELGIQGDVTESHNANDYVPNLTNYASKGYDLVIAVGFLMAGAVGTVSQQYPNVKFAIIDSTPADAQGNAVDRPNVVALLFKEQEAGALVGVLTGMLEKQGKTPKQAHKVGAVGGVSIPPVDHYIAGFQWAVKMEDPTAKVFVSYSDDFADPTKCSDKANAQIAGGADVVFQVAGGCGLGVLTTAKDKGVYSIGVDTDQSSVSPSVIASAVKRVDTATFAAIKSVTDGSFKAGVSTFSLSNDGVGFTKGNIDIPADIQTEIDKVSGEIKAGTANVPDKVATPDKP
jgi:basic membrane protein A and related proteins